MGSQKTKEVLWKGVLALTQAQVVGACPQSVRVLCKGSGGDPSRPAGSWLALA